MAMPTLQQIIGTITGKVAFERTQANFTIIKDAHNSLETNLTTHKAEIASKHIKESGTNANGSYIKFDDGTMICNHLVTLVYLSNWTMGTTWTLPAAFIVNPKIVANFAQGGTLADSTLAKAVPFKVVDVTTSSCVLNMLELAGGFISGDTIPMFTMSIGRWK